VEILKVKNGKWNGWDLKSIRFRRATQVDCVCIFKIRRFPRTQIPTNTFEVPTYTENVIFDLKEDYIQSYLCAV